TSDSGCSSSQKCSGNKCVAVSCGTCETASNHTCVKKSGCCTSDSDCGSGKECKSNSCVAITCPSNCSRCSSSSTCTSCDSGYKLSNGKCLRSLIGGGDVCNCPAGYGCCGGGGCYRLPTRGDPSIGACQIR
ncbi:MAG: hypothetical protein ACI4PW_05665, partial [Alphaproteobacteria bacterium]